jgi:ribosomal-protein-alanine N-acetyltransferase
LAPSINTKRLQLVAADATSARAGVIAEGRLEAGLDRDALGVRLGAKVPPEWPPEITGDALPYFAERLERDPGLAGWLMWFWIRAEDRVLIGNGGFGGRPDGEGAIVCGYAVMDSYQGKGYATEAMAGLIDWAFEQASEPPVERIRAETFGPLVASIRVLDKNGFVRVGEIAPGLDEPADLGPKLIFERKR